MSSGTSRPSDIALRHSFSFAFAAALYGSELTHAHLTGAVPTSAAVYVDATIHEELLQKYNAIHGNRGSVPADSLQATLVQVERSASKKRCHFARGYAC